MKNKFFICCTLLSTLLISLIIYAVASFAAPPILHRTEAFYQQKIAEKVGGQQEVVLEDGTRVDIVTQSDVIEVEFAHKWYEACGQSLFYSYLTGKAPVIWLVVENKNEERFVNRCLELAPHIYMENKDKKYQVKVNIYRAYR